MRKKSYVIFHTANAFLLLQKNKTGLWELPGGKKNKHETYAQTAKRESLEETGICFEINDFKKVNVLSKPSHFAVFIVKVEHKFNCFLSKEHKNYLWADSSHVQGLDLNAKVEKIIGHIKEKFLKNYL